MKRKLDLPAAPPVSAWSVTVTPPVAGDTRWRARLLEATHRELARRLPRAPAATTFRWGNPLLQVQVERQSGPWQPGAQIQLAYRAALPGGPGTPTAPGAPAPFLRQELPDER